MAAAPAEIDETYELSHRYTRESGRVYLTGVQALVRLPDLSKMQVKVTIHESKVDQLRSGMSARVVIQDQEYEGKVISVANQPERTSWFSAKRPSANHPMDIAFGATNRTCVVFDEKACCGT